MLNPNKINTNTFIKRLFEEQYGNSPALFAKYQQLDKREKILFVDGIDNIKTDTQETKKKVLGGYIREPFEFSFSWAERTGAEATKRIAPAPTVVKHVVKKFSKFRVVWKWWENARFCPENAKNKAENEPFSALFGAGVHNGFD